MECLTLYNQLISFACAPIYANTAGKPLQKLSGEAWLPHGGLSLADWPFGEGQPRSWHGLMSPEPGSQVPIAPVGIMPTPQDMPNTGYLYRLPETQSGSIVTARG